MQQNVYTVSQVNSYIATILSQNNVLSRICIKGELSNCKYHTSGHIYFTLKDNGSQMNAVMWASNVRSLKVRLQDGMQVVATGQVKAYEKGGTYQLYADEIEPDGMGALYEMFERLKRQLSAEGLFAPEHKKPIPAYCKTVGIVTAKTGAAVRDIINISTRRNPYVQLILYPALVQGQGAAESVIRGIKEFEKLKSDVIIIGRGGGSIEDLWGFNDEALARTIYACEIPIISAVGHETDFTISDYVSDLRAPTPSAAAELAVCEIDKLMAQVVDLHSDLVGAMQGNIEYSRHMVDELKLRLKLVSPREKLNRERKDLELDSEKLHKLMQNKITDSKHKLALQISALEGVSPLRRLEAGYAYVTDSEGHNIKSSKSVKSGDEINIRVTDGTVGACVTEVKRG